MEFGDPSFIHQWPINSVDELSSLSMAAVFGENLHQSYSQPMFDLKHSMEISDTGLNRSMKMLKTNSWNSCITDQLSNIQAVPSPKTLPYVNSNYTNEVGLVKPKEEAVFSKSNTNVPLEISFGDQNQVFTPCQRSKRIRLSQAQDHIIAERKRREKLSQRLIALSALVPGLKKMDKASVLGDAIKYLKQLQEQVKTLEEQSRKKSIESVVYVKKFELHSDPANSSTYENFSGGPLDEPLLEIEARVSDKDVLIRIHSEKRKGILEKTIGEIEKHHLSVINSSVMTFGNYALDITIIAQVIFYLLYKDPFLSD
ncbi:unnamed protein product [Ilex paraguariensis]|uniref:BHLH domain-containing protein n=1 Tax=Ilex paraguariensis TaxID=185542 RepID=A0ABC8RKB6_9AQUA